MNENKKRKIRDIIRYSGAIVCSPLYLPHLICAKLRNRALIKSDVRAMMKSQKINVKSEWLSLLYLLHNNRYYRTLFYHRIGPVLSLMIGWLRRGYHDFQISATTEIGESCILCHPYATILNAHSIGKNFSFRHCTTLGTKKSATDRPIIGDNVTLGAAVTIIGDVRIGDNVIIGAGSVVMKDIPSNCIAAGNPAKVIRTNTLI